MAITQSDIDALNSALAQGERLVRFSDGRTVEYRSVAELITARNDLQRQLSNAKSRPRVGYLVHGGRGFQ